MLVLIVMVAIVAAILAASLPGLIAMDRLSRVQRTALILTDLDTLINNGTAAIKAFEQRVGRNPGRLSQLTDPITNADRNSCGNTYTNGQVTNWQTWGPFGSYTVDPAGGLKTPIGIANDLLIRNPPGGGANSTIEIVFPNVDFEDVEMLDDLMDAGDGRIAGLVQWTVPSLDGTTTMSYVSSINNLC